MNNLSWEKVLVLFKEMFDLVSHLAGEVFDGKLGGVALGALIELRLDVVVELF